MSVYSFSLLCNMPARNSPPPPPTPKSSTILHKSFAYLFIYLCHHRQELPSSSQETSRQFYGGQRKASCLLLHLAITKEGYLARTLRRVFYLCLSLSSRRHVLHRTHSLAHFLPICFHRGYVFTRTSAAARRSSRSLCRHPFGRKTRIRNDRHSQLTYHLHSAHNKPYFLANQII